MLVLVFPLIALLASEPSSLQIDSEKLMADTKKWMSIAERAKYARAPHDLPALTDTCGAYFLAAKPPPLGWAVSGAVLERAADSAVIAMSSFENSVVLFPQLTPGLYRLRAIRISPSHLGLFSSPDYVVSVLGRPVQVEGGKVRPDFVRVSLGTFGNNANISTYRDPELERTAWNRFHKKYGESTWEANLSAPVDSTQSPVAEGDSTSSH